MVAPRHLFPAVFDRHARVARADQLRREATRHHATGGDDGIRTDRHARRHENLSADPGTIIDDDGLAAISHVRLAIIVITGADENALGDTAMGANGDRLQVEDENFLPDPGMIPDRQFPGEMDVHARLDDHAGADGGAERTEDGTFEAGRKRQRGQKHSAFQQIPNGLDEFGAAAIEPPGGNEQIISYTGHEI